MFQQFILSLMTTRYFAVVFYYSFFSQYRTSATLQVFYLFNCFVLRLSKNYIFSIWFFITFDVDPLSTRS